MIKAIYEDARKNRSENDNGRSLKGSGTFISKSRGAAKSNNFIINIICVTEEIY